MSGPGAAAAPAPTSTFGGINYSSIVAGTGNDDSYFGSQAVVQAGARASGQAATQAAVLSFSNRFMQMSRIDGRHDGFALKDIAKYFPDDSYYAARGLNEQPPSIIDMQNACFGRPLDPPPTKLSPQETLAGAMDYEYRLVKRVDKGDSGDDREAANAFEEALGDMGIPGGTDIFLYVDVNCGLYTMLNSLNPPKYSYTTVHNRATITDPAGDTTPELGANNQFSFDRNGSPNGKKVEFAIEAVASQSPSIEGFRNQQAYFDGLAKGFLNLNDERLISGTFASKYTVNLQYKSALKSLSAQGGDGPNPREIGAVLTLCDKSNQNPRLVVMDSGACAKNSRGRGLPRTAQALWHNLWRKRKHWYGNRGTHALGKKCGDWLQVVQTLKPGMKIHRLESVTQHGQFHYKPPEDVGPARAIVTHDRFEKTYALLCGAPIVVFKTARKGGNLDSYYEVYVKKFLTVPSLESLKAAMARLESATNSFVSLENEFKRNAGEIRGTIATVLGKCAARVGKAKDAITKLDGINPTTPPDTSKDFDETYKLAVSWLHNVDLVMSICNLQTVAWKQLEQDDLTAAAGAQAFLARARRAAIPGEDLAKAQQQVNTLTDKVIAATNENSALVRIAEEALSTVNDIMPDGEPEPLMSEGLKNSVAIYKWKTGQDSQLQGQLFIDENVGASCLRSIAGTEKKLREGLSTLKIIAENLSLEPPDASLAGRWEQLSEKYSLEVGRLQGVLNARKTAANYIRDASFNWADFRTRYQAFPPPHFLPTARSRGLYAAYVSKNLERAVELLGSGAGAGAGWGADGGGSMGDGGGFSGGGRRRSQAGGADVDDTKGTVPPPPKKPRVGEAGAAVETQAEAEAAAAAKAQAEAEAAAAAKAQAEAEAAAEAAAASAGRWEEEETKEEAEAKAQAEAAAKAQAEAAAAARADELMDEILYNYAMVFDNQVVFLRAEQALGASPAQAAQPAALGPIGSEAELVGALGIAATIGPGGPGALLNSLKRLLDDKEAVLAGAGADADVDADVGMELVLEIHELSNQVNMLKLFVPNLERSRSDPTPQPSRLPPPQRSQSETTSTPFDPRRYVRVIDNIHLYGAELFPDNDDRDVPMDSAHTAARTAWNNLQRLEGAMYGCEAMEARAEAEAAAAAPVADADVGAGPAGAAGAGPAGAGPAGAAGAGPAGAAGAGAAGAGMDKGTAIAVYLQNLDFLNSQIQRYIGLRAQSQANRLSLWWNVPEQGRAAGAATKPNSMEQGGGKRHTRKRKASSTRRGRRTRRKKRRRRGGLASKTRPKRKPRRRTIGRKPVRGKRASRKR